MKALKLYQLSIWGIVAIGSHFSSTNALAVDIRFADLVPETGLVRHECAARNLYGLKVRIFEPDESLSPCPAADEKTADVSDHDMAADQSVANAIRHGAYDILQPIDDATLAQRLLGCRGFGPLAAFRDWVDLAWKGGTPADASLLGTSNDGSFEKIGADFDGTTRTLIAEDGIQGYMLGKTKSGGELLGIVASSYSNHDFSDDTLKAEPRRPDDVRIAATGILHLISIPECRYGGGIVLKSRALVKQKVSFMYDRPWNGTIVMSRSDFVYAWWSAREYVRNDLVRIEGKVFLLSADLPVSTDREILVDRIYEDVAREIINQGALDRSHRQKRDILPGLAGRGIPFRIKESPPEYRLKVWELGLLDDLLVVAQWIKPTARPMDPTKCYLIYCMPEDKGSPD